MIHQRWYEFGTVFGMRYLFDNAGEGLAMHSHPESQVHNVLVLRGKIGIRGVNEANGTVSALIAVPAVSIIDALPYQHELVALEPGTELLNLYKYGKPPEYDHLPDSEKNVTMESPQLSTESEELPWNKSQ